MHTVLLVLLGMYGRVNTQQTGDIANAGQNTRAGAGRLRLSGLQDLERLGQMPLRQPGLHGCAAQPAPEHLLQPIRAGELTDMTAQRGELRLKVSVMSTYCV